MLLKYRIKTASAGLVTNKSRSLLTILGIVIGITAIIIVMSIGKGAENLILGEIEGIGATTISVDPGRQPEGPSSFAELYTDTLRQKDVDALRNPSNVQGIKDISPIVVQPAVVSYEGESVRKTIYGGSETFADIISIRPEQGRFFTEDEVDQQARVAVLGASVREDLFGLSDAVGQSVRIKDQRYRVIGLLPEKGQSLMDIDNMVVLPYTTVQQYLSGASHFNSLIIQAESEEVMARVVHDIEATLRESHGITDPANDDFNVTTQAEAVETLGVITAVLTALLGSVAGISLVVGGIGIMNIMLVSVRERPR